VQRLPAFLSKVPNVPCGVESPLREGGKEELKLFLMYRVELKAYPSSTLSFFFNCS
jgi:hypothetical protein